MYKALLQRVQMDPINKDEVTPAYVVCCSLMYDDDSLSRGSHIFDVCFNADKLRLRRRGNFKASSEPVLVDGILIAIAIVLEISFITIPYVHIYILKVLLHVCPCN